MELKKLVSGFWLVFLGETLVARIYLDFLHQMEYLVLFTTDTKLQRQLKELVLFHAQNYVKNRSNSGLGGLLTERTTNNDLTERDSDHAMDFILVTDEIKNLDDASIDASLEGTVEVIQAKFQSYSNLIKAVLEEIKNETGIHLSIWNPVWDKLLGQDDNAIKFHILTEVDVKIRFTVHSEHKFRFWKVVNFLDHKNDPNDLFHIVPGYHPEAKGWTEFAMVNGDTDALIGEREHGINYIYCPLESISGPGSAFGSWSSINHPYYATGTCFDLQVSAIRLLSQEAFDSLKGLLLSALELNETFISICGGFDPPYHYPSMNSRGSERDWCAWEFHQLQNDNALPGAIIPPWFLEEECLQIYPE
jgi:hypothetical protein